MKENFNTPMMKQYLAIKKKYQDCLLLYRMGDFYELFLDDAVIGSKVLGITLTSRSKGKDGRIPMAGVPYHAVDTYLHRLVKAGHKVAICEQLSEPNSKGIVDRDVIRIVTPGTILDELALDRTKNNYIISIAIKRNTVAISCADISTGEFLTEEIDSEQPDQVIVDELMRLHPAECIISSESYQDTHLLRLLSEERHMSVTSIQNWQHTPSSVSSRLLKHFGVLTLASFGIETKLLCQETCLALYEYLLETQKGKLSHIRGIKLMHTEDALQLDRSTILNLELFSTIREHDTTGSLLETIDDTKTAMGARQLKQWMCAPLRRYEDISLRLDSVEYLFSNSTVRRKLITQLSQITDIERMISRLSVGVGNARDLIHLQNALSGVHFVREILTTIPDPLIQMIGSQINNQINKVISLIGDTIIEAPAMTIKDGHLIRDGIDQKLDHLRMLVDRGDNWLHDFEEQERNRTSISSLKVRFNSVFGYYIDITKSNLSHVPKEYIRRQTLVNSERYTTAELKEHEVEMLTAREEANRLEYELYSKTLDEVLLHTQCIQDACSAIATIDCLVNFAQIASLHSYCHPKLLYSNELNIQDGRHPVVERLLRDEPFVPNSVHIDSLQPQLLIITGPNMAGKSVLIRQTALIVLLCHMGSFVPAKAAHIGIVDRIFVRSGASDVITSGLSTFMVEMVETAHILQHATEKSLIVMDEIGRGTSTYDGISIAWAVATYLVTTIKAKTLFATHYHELQALEELHPKKILNYHMAVRENETGPVFLHTLLPKGATSSFGIDVAKLAGVPVDVLDLASKKLSELESRDHQPIKIATMKKKAKSSVEETIASLSISHLTPIESLNILAKMQAELLQKAP